MTKALPETAQSPIWADPAFNVSLYHGDCLDVLAAMPDACVDAVVTDPPYYDAIPYSDLMDFFYLWLWRGVGAVVMGVVVFLSVGAIELLARLP